MYLIRRIEDDTYVTRINNTEYLFVRDERKELNLEKVPRRERAWKFHKPVEGRAVIAATINRGLELLKVSV